MNNFGKFQTFGNEFNQIYQQQLNNNLMNPTAPQTDFNTGETVTVYNNTGEVYNQQLIFENNQDADEDQRYTYGQAQQNVMKSFNNARPLTRNERAVNNYTDNDYSPEFRQQLVEDSIKSGSNIFSTVSQDFVREVQESNLSFRYNDNLYDLNPNPDAAMMQLMKLTEQQINNVDSKTDMINRTLNTAADTLFDMADKERQQKANDKATKQRFSDRFRPKDKKTLNEKFNIAVEGVY